MKIDQPFRRVARSPTFVARVGRNSGLDGNQRHRGPDRLAKDQVRPRFVDCLAGLLASITAIAALTALAVVRSAHVPGSSVPGLRASSPCWVRRSTTTFSLLPFTPSTSPIPRT
jgi:hypothetical protein